jgi:hypothetical protein
MNESTIAATCTTNKKRRRREEDDENDNAGEDGSDNDEQDGNPEKDDDDSQEDDVDDDDLMTMDVPLLLGTPPQFGTSKGGMNNKQSTAASLPPEKPADDLVWDNNAILDCFHWTVSTHDHACMTTQNDDPKSAALSSSSSMYWKTPPLFRQQQTNNKIEKNNDAALLLSAEEKHQVLTEFQNHPPPTPSRSLKLPSWAVDTVEQTVIVRTRPTMPKSS